MEKKASLIILRRFEHTSLKFLPLSCRSSVLLRRINFSPCMTSLVIPMSMARTKGISSHMTLWMWDTIRYEKRIGSHLYVTKRARAEFTSNFDLQESRILFLANMKNLKGWKTCHQLNLKCHSINFKTSCSKQ